MWIFLWACISSPPEPLTLDIRPRVRIQRSTLPNQALRFQYNTTLLAIQDVTITSETGGEITQILHKSGDSVSAKTTVVRINSDRALAQILLAEAQLEDAKAQDEDAQLLFDRLSALESTTAKADLDRSRIALLRTSAGVKSAKASLKLAQIHLQSLELKSPIDGEIASITLEEGERLLPGQPAFRIVNTSSIKAKVGIGQEQRLLLQSTQPDAYIVQNDTQFPAEIVESPIAALPGSLTWNLSLECQPSMPLLPGTPATAILEFDPPQAEALITIESLNMSGSVLTLEEDNTIRNQEVEIVAEHGSLLYVNGIAPDTKLILHPNVDWTDGTEVVTIEEKQ